MLGDLEKQLAEERCRQLRREAQIAGLLKVNRSARVRLRRQVEEQLGELPVATGYRLKRGARLQVSPRSKEAV